MRSFKEHWEEQKPYNNVYVFDAPSDHIVDILRYCAVRDIVNLPLRVSINNVVGYGGVFPIDGYISKHHHFLLLTLHKLRVRPK